MVQSRMVFAFPFAATKSVIDFGVYRGAAFTPGFRMAALIPFIPGILFVSHTSVRVSWVNQQPCMCSMCRTNVAGCLLVLTLCLGDNLLSLRGNVSFHEGGLVTPHSPVVL